MNYSHLMYPLKYVELILCQDRSEMARKYRPDYRSPPFQHSLWYDFSVQYYNGFINHTNNVIKCEQLYVNKEQRGQAFR